MRPQRTCSLNPPCVRAGRQQQLQRQQLSPVCGKQKRGDTVAQALAINPDQGDSLIHAALTPAATARCSTARAQASSSALPSLKRAALSRCSTVAWRR